MVKPTKKHINDALDYEIELWREAQRAALAKVVWPSISGDADAFKAAAMFNFGVDAAKTIYPTAAALISKATVPLWILGQAQAAFKAMYQSSINHANKKLSNNFTTLSDNFIRKIQDIARTFINSNSGRKMCNDIYQKVKDIEFKDDAQRRALLRVLIKDANLIDTDPTSIRNKTNAGFVKICKKIRDIWKATYHDPWVPDAVLWFSPSFQKYWYRDGSVDQKWQHIRNKDDQDWIIRNAYRMDVKYIKRLGNQRDDCYVTLTKASNITNTFMTPNINPQRLNQAVSKLKQTIAKQK